MKKTIFVFSVVLFTAMPVVDARASLLTVDPEGTIEWSVLSYESDSPKVEVRQLMDHQKSTGLISLNNKSGDYQLRVQEGNAEKLLDVSDYQEQLIEVEATNVPEKMSISLRGGELNILQNGITAKTNLPLNLDTKGKTLGFETSSGLQYLAVLPSEAVNVLVRANIIGVIPQDGTVRITQEENGSLSYSVQGEREIKIANIVNIPVEVKASVSASDGSIVSVNQPIWASILSLIFS